ncbi:hypothetical protein EII17_06110 [Clostridiales bacterium COT073_COT-073]|nr:hypothetical protein EII17_06110 [Clostridiales bacterium COT073_COT-073]
MKQRIMEKRKSMSLILSMMIMLQIFNGISYAATGQELDLQRDHPIPAKVLEVIESNVYKLLVYDQVKPHVETYYLIGVKPNGNQAAYDYSLKKLLNQSVYFLEDENIPVKNDLRFCYLYVDFNISHNEDLIRRGLALADPEFKSSKEYLKYSRSQEVAQSQSKGIFDFSDKKTSDQIININSAGIEQIMNHFKIDNFKASKWYARISGNPINQIGELRALDKDFFTPEVILEYAPSIHLRTNLQTASPYEIASLVSRSTNNSKIIDEILKYRLFKEVVNKEDFKKIPISENYRNAIYPYLTFTNEYHSFQDVDGKIININTADEVQIANALGINLAHATILKNYRKSHNYPLRFVEELFKPYFPLNKELSSMDALTDNIRMYTNINSAGEYEIRSLFGDISMTSSQLTTAVQAILKERPFKDKAALEKTIGKVYTAKIIDFIYFDHLPESKLLNINTASRDKIAEYFNLTNNQKAQLHSQYLSPSDLPGFLSKYIQQITLYTNINRAGFEELHNLTPDITKALAEDIIKNRSGEGYYTLEDVRVLFEKHNLEDTYHKIKQYLILQ